MEKITFKFKAKIDQLKAEFEREKEMQAESSLDKSRVSGMSFKKKNNQRGDFMKN